MKRFAEILLLVIFFGLIGSFVAIVMEGSHLQWCAIVMLIFSIISVAVTWRTDKWRDV
jgi:hypothetical protein